MTRHLAGIAALAALPLLGCDAVDFPPLVEPPPDPAIATIHLRYIHGDSLEGNVTVVLRSWLPPGSTAEVLLGGRSVPRVEGLAPAATFQDTWTVAPDSTATLPQVLAMPGPADDPLLIPLPVVVRQGSAVVCVGDQDPVLRFSEIAVAQPAATSWTLHLGAGGPVVHGNGFPPEPLRLPRELLGTLTQPLTVDLLTSVRAYTEFEDAILVLSATLLVRWTLVGSAVGDAACPAP